MANKSRLLSILKVSFGLLEEYDQQFDDPVWVAKSMGISARKALQRINYLRRNKSLNRDYSLKSEENNPFLLVNLDWDNEWRIVVYDINQEDRKERRIIRGLLSNYGFRKLQRSVWLSPLKIEEKFEHQLSNNGVSEFSLITGTLYGVNPQKLVKKLWLTNRWQKKARNLISKLKSEGDSLDNRRKFWDLALNYPKLPRQLLPFYWPIQDLAKEFVCQINE